MADRREPGAAGEPLFHPGGLALTGAQTQAVELTLLLSVPCVVAFLLVPDLIMRALFLRGVFTEADAQAAAATLSAYAIGLLPFVLLRSAAITFLARGDTMTPVIALGVAVAVNLALKLLLMDRYAQVGLAFATAVGAWVNFAMLLWLARRRGLITFDLRLVRPAAPTRMCPAAKLSGPRRCEPGPAPTMAPATGFSFLYCLAPMEAQRPSRSCWPTMSWVCAT